MEAWMLCFYVRIADTWMVREGCLKPVPQEVCVAQLRDWSQRMDAYVERVHLPHSDYLGGCRPIAAPIDTVPATIHQTEPNQAR